MMQDEIIEMAKQAEFCISPIDSVLLPKLERFAKLVAQHEREKTVWTQKHWTEYEQKLVEDERDACAKVVVDLFFQQESPYHYIPDARSALKEAHLGIRVRGDKK